MYEIDLPSAQYPFYPYLVAEARRDGSYESGLRYWLYLCVFDEFEYLYKPSVVARILQEFFSVSERYARKILARYTGKLWDYTRSRSKSAHGSLRVYSPLEVATAYGLQRPGRRTYVYAETLNGPDHLADSFMRSAEYFYKSMATPPTKRQIRKTTGVTQRTQYNYCKSLQVKRIPNMVLEKLFTSYDDALSDLLDSGGVVGMKRAAALQVHTRSGGIVQICGLFRQIGSSFEFTKYRETENSDLIFIGNARGMGIWCPKHLGPELPTIMGVPIYVKSTPEPEA